MSLDQYNFLMSNMLNQQCALTKLRAELEGRDRRKCWSCKKFRHLACNCRNKNEKKKGEPIPRNKFEVLSSRVMRCEVREEVRIKRNEMVEEVKCFRCWGVGHFKWECPNIEVEKKRKEERLVYSLWRKAQEYSSAWGMPQRSAVLEQKE